MQKMTIHHAICRFYYHLVISLFGHSVIRIVKFFDVMRSAVSGAYCIVCSVCSVAGLERCSWQSCRFHFSSLCSATCAFCGIVRRGESLMWFCRFFVKKVRNTHLWLNLESFSTTCKLFFMFVCTCNIYTILRVKSTYVQYWIYNTYIRGNLKILGQIPKIYVPLQLLFFFLFRFFQNAFVEMTKAYPLESCRFSMFKTFISSGRD